MARFRQKQFSEGDRQFFIHYICQLEGFKTKAKNLHWAAQKKNIHVYLDEFLEIISNFQDTIAEGYMGILGQMGPRDIKGIECDCDSAIPFIESVIEKTKDFYDNIPESTEFKGITSETETFIQNSQKYRYLFGLCDC